MLRYRLKEDDRALDEGALDTAIVFLLYSPASVHSHYHCPI